MPVNAGTDETSTRRSKMYENNDEIGKGRLDNLPYEMPPDKPILIRDALGALTRAGALWAARQIEEMSMVYVNIDGTCVMWKIGHFNETVTRSKNWDETLVKYLHRWDAFNTKSKKKAQS